MAEHRGLDKAVFEIHRSVVVTHQAGKLRDPRDRRPGCLRHRLGHPDMVLVLVCE